MRKGNKIKHNLSFSSVSCLMCCSQKGRQRCCSDASWPRGIYFCTWFLVARLLYEYFFIAKHSKGERDSWAWTAWWVTEFWLILIIFFCLLLVSFFLILFSQSIIEGSGYWKAKSWTCRRFVWVFQSALGKRREIDRRGLEGAYVN